MSNFTDGLPRVATAEDLQKKWSGDAKNFRCYICGEPFKVGDTWRWVFMAEQGLINFLVCVHCDGPDVRDKFKAHHAHIIKTGFWALTRG